MRLVADIIANILSSVYYIFLLFTTTLCVTVNMFHMNRQNGYGPSFPSLHLPYFPIDTTPFR